MTRPAKASNRIEPLWPAVMVFVAAGLWGLYWLPIRRMDAAGIDGLWAVLGVHLAPMLVLIPLAIVRWRQICRNAGRIALVGVLNGSAMVLYAAAFLYTSVMRTTLLFYLIPIWSTLLAILILREQPGPRRWLAIAIGLTGLLIMIGVGGDSDAAFNTRFNLGDWYALAAGMLWAGGVVAIRSFTRVHSIDYVPMQYLASCAVAAALLMLTDAGPMPSMAHWQQALPWLFGFYVLIMLPSLYACILAAQLISPGRVGILMMSEVLVAGVSAPLLAGEMLSLVEWAAASLIVGAAVLEVSSAEPAAQNIEKIADQSPG